MTEPETAAVTDGIEVEVTTPEVDDEPPEDNPFHLVENGVVEIPEVEGWECSGTVYQSETDDYSIAWKGEFPVPGFPWSEKAVVAVEYDPMISGFGLVFYPFDENGESDDGFVQPRLFTEYDSLWVALLNAEAYLEKLAEVEEGDVVVIDNKGYEV